jgi:hypothetical protein
MNSKQIHFLIKAIAVKSAELVESMQWSDSNVDRIEVAKVANELADLTRQLLAETV